MAPIVRKRRRVPRRIGEANPPGIFSKAKCVFVSLAGSEYHHANRPQPDAATRASSQSTRSVVDKASRRTDQLEPVYCLLRTCAMPTHHALVPLQVPRSVRRLSSSIAHWQPPEDLEAAQVFPAGGR